MPSYDYKCPVCGHLYNEVRQVTDPQWVTDCPVADCNGVLEDITGA